MSMYAEKRVLVTGGASFIGSHLVDALVRGGAIVTVVDDLSSGRMENLHESLEKITFVRGDLRLQAVADEVTREKDVVFHLANVHGGRGFIETHPGEIVQNFMIDGNVFYFAHRNKVGRLCYTSSACAYPTSLQTADPGKQVRFLSEEMADPFREGAALADGEYGWAKFMGEMALKAYHKQFGMQGVSCRLFTVYGPRENESHAIIAFISKATVTAGSLRGLGDRPAGQELHVRRRHRRRVAAGCRTDHGLPGGQPGNGRDHEDRRRGEDRVRHRRPRTFEVLLRYLEARRGACPGGKHREPGEVARLASGDFVRSGDSKDDRVVQGRRGPAGFARRSREKAVREVETGFRGHGEANAYSGRNDRSGESRRDLCH